MRKPVGVSRQVVMRNTKTGAIVGLGGSAPYYNSEDAKDWVTETQGWVPVWDDGVRGWCYPPFKTEEEANRWLEEFLAKS